MSEKSKINWDKIWAVIYYTFRNHRYSDADLSNLGV